MGRTAPFWLKTGGRTVCAPRRAPLPDMPTSTGQGAKRAGEGGRAEEAVAGGTVKKENKKSALGLLKFDTVAANVAGVPAQSAGVYGVTARENPLAPLDS